MAEQMNRRRTFMTDEEKKNVLNDLRTSLDSGNVTSDTKLAQSVTRITSTLEQLAMSAQTTADLSFTVNLVDYTVDCVATHLETNDPIREQFQELIVADDISMESWCPGGYSQLEEITRACVPLRLSFQKYITLKDLEEQRGEPKEAPIRERKKRMATHLSKAPTTSPKKVACTDVQPTHHVHLEIVRRKLVELTQDSPIPFFKFVINPNSFVQTVYNVFIASFLVHEEHAVLSVGENHELLIQFDSQSNNVEGESTIQLVHSISPVEWISLAKHLKISSPLLPELCPKESQYFKNIQLSEEILSGVTFLNP